MSAKLAGILKRHYLENVLEHEPNPKYEELKERLKGPGRRRLLAVMP